MGGAILETETRMGRRGPGQPVCGPALLFSPGPQTLGRGHLSCLPPAVGLAEGQRQASTGSPGQAGSHSRLISVPWDSLQPPLGNLPT